MEKHLASFQVWAIANEPARHMQKCTEVYVDIWSQFSWINKKGPMAGSEGRYTFIKGLPNSFLRWL